MSVNHTKHKANKTRYRTALTLGALNPEPLTHEGSLRGHQYGGLLGPQLIRVLRGKSRVFFTSCYNGRTETGSQFSVYSLEA